MKKLITLVLIVFSSTSMAAELTATEKSAIVSAVKHELKDADSAKFKWPKLATKINPKHFVDSYCGLVNAKNSYGGYTGFEPFLAQVARSDDGKFEVISVSMPNGDLTASDIAEMCSADGYANLRATK